MGTQAQGWVTEAQAVEFVAANPEVMTGPRKTALLQRFSEETKKLIIAGSPGICENASA